MQLLDPTFLKDKRTDCVSFIFHITVGEYLKLIAETYQDRGGIKGQREPLKSNSALRIRKQMVKDIKVGAILPPIVLGLIVSPTVFESLTETSREGLAEIITQTSKENITIIDGMQRTTALSDAVIEGSDPNHIIRIEFWISTKINSLIYRMLVLNTGQVPWNLRRQIETVFSSMIKEMKESIPEMQVYYIDDPNRRSQGGQYKADDLIELYLAFGSRKEKVDTKERLADEFTRLDFIEATENVNFSDVFYLTLIRLVTLDIEFSRFQGEENTARFVSGKDLFKGQPAKVGFVTAVAKRIYGRPGFEKSETEVSASIKLIMSKIDDAIKYIKKLTPQELSNYLSFDLLNEKLSIKTSRVGDFEREYFNKAFETFIDEGENLPSLEACWLSY